MKFEHFYWGNPKNEWGYEARSSVAEDIIKQYNLLYIMGMRSLSQRQWNEAITWKLSNGSQGIGLIDLGKNGGMIWHMIVVPQSKSVAESMRRPCALFHFVYIPLKEKLAFNGNWQPLIDAIIKYDDHQSKTLQDIVEKQNPHLNFIDPFYCDMSSNDLSVQIPNHDIWGNRLTLDILLGWLNGILNGYNFLLMNFPDNLDKLELVHSLASFFPPSLRGNIGFLTDAPQINNPYISITFLKRREKVDEDSLPKRLYIDWDDLQPLANLEIPTIPLLRHLSATLPSDNFLYDLQPLQEFHLTFEEEFYRLTETLHPPDVYNLSGRWLDVIETSNKISPRPLNDRFIFINDVLVLLSDDKTLPDDKRIGWFEHISIFVLRIPFENSDIQILRNWHDEILRHSDLYKIKLAEIFIKEFTEQPINTLHYLGHLSQVSVELKDFWLKQISNILDINNLKTDKLNSNLLNWLAKHHSLISKDDLSNVLTSFIYSYSGVSEKDKEKLFSMFFISEIREIMIPKIIKADVPIPKLVRDVATSEETLMAVSKKLELKQEDMIRFYYTWDKPQAFNHPDIARMLIQKESRKYIIYMLKNYTYYSSNVLAILIIELQLKLSSSDHDIFNQLSFQYIMTSNSSTLSLIYWNELTKTLSFSTQSNVTPKEQNYPKRCYELFADFYNRIVEKLQHDNDLFDFTYQTINLFIDIQKISIFINITNRPIQDLFKVICANPDSEQSNRVYRNSKLLNELFMCLEKIETLAHLRITYIQWYLSKYLSESVKQNQEDITKFSRSAIFKPLYQQAFIKYYLDLKKERKIEVYNRMAAVNSTEKKIMDSLRLPNLIYPDNWEEFSSHIQNSLHILIPLIFLKDIRHIWVSKINSPLLTPQEYANRLSKIALASKDISMEMPRQKNHDQDEYSFSDLLQIMFNQNSSITPSLVWLHTYKRLLPTHYKNNKNSIPYIEKDLVERAQTIKWNIMKTTFQDTYLTDFKKYFDSLVWFTDLRRNSVIIVEKMKIDADSLNKALDMYTSNISIGDEEIMDKLAELLIFVDAMRFLGQDFINSGEELGSIGQRFGQRDKNIENAFNDLISTNRQPKTILAKLSKVK